MKQLEYHPASEYFPLMPEDRLKELAEDIDANGLLEPIWLHDGKILDGRNRYRACLLKKIDPIFQDYEGDRPVAFVLSKNLKRRDLSMVQRLAISDKARPELESEAKARQAKTLKIGDKSPLASIDANGKRVREHIAEEVGTSPKTVERFSEIQKHGTPELKAAVESEEVSISDAASIAKAPPSVQRSAVAAVESGKAKTLREAAAKHSRNGKPVFDDRIVESLIGKLMRTFDARGAVHGKEKGFKDCYKQMELLLAAWKRWQRETTGARR